jgi:hypothetical protein
MTKIWLVFYIAGRVIGSAGPEADINLCWRHAAIEKSTFDRLVPSLQNNLLVDCEFHVHRPQVTIEVS